MTLAQINIDTVRSVYSSESYRDSGDLETVAQETGGEISQNWADSETVISYTDGSKIVMCGPSCDAR